MFAVAITIETSLQKGEELGNHGKVIYKHSHIAHQINEPTKHFCFSDHYLRIRWGIYCICWECKQYILNTTKKKEKNPLKYCDIQHHSLIIGAILCHCSLFCRSMTLPTGLHQDVNFCVFRFVRDEMTRNCLLFYDGNAVLSFISFWPSFPPTGWVNCIIAPQALMYKDPWSPGLALVSTGCFINLSLSLQPKISTWTARHLNWLQHPFHFNQK